LLSQDFTALAAQVSNWGRWGDQDELGTLNLIDATAVQRGAACVRTGKRFSLSLPLDENGPQIGGVPGRVNATRTMTQINAEFTGTPDGFCTSDDVVTMGLQAATHWDALAHVSYSGQLYNGIQASSITEAGAARCGIERVESLTTRGVLLDVARARGVDRLDAGYGITPDDLDAALPVELAPGDVVVSAHACGALTDVILERAVAASARVAVLPCCHAHARSDTGNLEGWLDPALAIDVTRDARLAGRGYSVHTLQIPAAITPKSRLLVGAPRRRA